MTRATPIVSYVTALEDLGYSFRLNEAGDTIEVNGKRLDDFELATIRARMRAEGFSADAVDDIIKMMAAQNRYHPIRSYLISNGMNWDGRSHILTLAAHFLDATTPHKMFEIWLRKWLIGAVAKAMDGRRHQNAMLVLDGPQGIGKSTFAKWLCSPLPDYYLDDAINPSDKDSHIRLATYWIWEVGELGATMRRSDVEALKAFISRQVVTVRRPYARLDMVKPALASMIGTVNNSAGILADSTGNRRFWVATIQEIDWNYTNLDPNQVWAEAFTAYTNGETWYLTPDERAKSEENNDQYRVPNIIEGYLHKYFYIEPQNHNKWTATNEIVARLIDMGYKGASSRSVAMDVASTLKELGLEKTRRRLSSGSNPIWGYLGIWPKLGVP